MSSHEKTFDEWRDCYFSATDEWERLEALENMSLTAGNVRENWSELHRIATNLEGCPVTHPFVVICSTGICLTPEAEVQVGSIFTRMRNSLFWKELFRIPL